MERVLSRVSGRRSTSATRSAVTQPRPGPAAHVVNDRTADRCRFHVRAAAPSHAAANTAAGVARADVREHRGVAEVAARPGHGLAVGAPGVVVEVAARGHPAASPLAARNTSMTPVRVPGRRSSSCLATAYGTRSASSVTGRLPRNPARDQVAGVAVAGPVQGEAVRQEEDPHLFRAGPAVVVVARADRVR